MSTLYNGPARLAIIGRLERLTPDNQQLWGKMSINQLLPHLGDSLRRALGDTPSEMPTKGIGRFAPVRYLYIHVLTWPKGKIPAPKGSFRTPSTGWEGDRKIIVDLIERFVTTPPSALSKVHPSLGRMSSRDWGVLMHKHMDHHLRQFSA